MKTSTEQKVHFISLLVISWVNKGDHDVSCPIHKGQSFVVVCESPRVHQRPAQTCVHNTAVVPQEPAPSSLQTTRAAEHHADIRHMHSDTHISPLPRHPSLLGHCRMAESCKNVLKVCPSKWHRCRHVQSLRWLSGSHILA